jgi:hypothetical protein
MPPNVPFIAVRVARKSRSRAPTDTQFTSAMPVVRGVFRRSCCSCRTVRAGGCCHKNLSATQECPTFAGGAVHRSPTGRTRHDYLRRKHRWRDPGRAARRRYRRPSVPVMSVTRRGNMPTRPISLPSSGGMGGTHLVVAHRAAAIVDCRCRLDVSPLDAAVRCCTGRAARHGPSDRAHVADGDRLHAVAEGDRVGLR